MPSTSIWSTIAANGHIKVSGIAISKTMGKLETPPHPSNVASDSADFCVHITVVQRNPSVSVEELNTAG